MLELTINGERRRVEVEPDTPLLWVLRDTLGLTGTKYGCGLAQCGACTVLMGGEAVRSCQLPAEAAVGQEVATIEAIEADAVGRRVVEAWVAQQVPQCGYCQSGQVMSAVALLRQTPKPTDDDIDSAMTGNLCRCATYVRIRAAIKDAAASLEG
jgi:isoquinoline 1-oxidoreductase alpha subunit